MGETAPEALKGEDWAGEMGERWLASLNYRPFPVCLDIKGGWLTMSKNYILEIKQVYDAAINLIKQ
jgi:hypothetical protein